MQEKNKTESQCLYVTATPIGNLADISERAVKVLTEVDFIAAEDTRRTALLLSHFNIKKPMVSYFEHNRRERGMEILRRILGGESCALVCDAGTPAISDPGCDLVELCREYGVKVVPVPGACAAVCALSASGMPSGRFTFEGFLSVSKSARREHLDSLKNELRTMIFYEAPHKLKATLKDMFDTFGDRKIVLARELTKINEEFIDTTLSEAYEIYKGREVRGEFVLILDGKPQNEQDSLEDYFWSDMTANEHVDYYIKSGYMRMEAIKLAAKDRDMTKGKFYDMLIRENSQSDG